MSDGIDAGLAELEAGGIGLPRLWNTSAMSNCK